MRGEKKKKKRNKLIHFELEEIGFIVCRGNAYLHVLYLPNNVIGPQNWTKKKHTSNDSGNNWREIDIVMLLPRPMVNTIVFAGETTSKRP